MSQILRVLVIAAREESASRAMAALEADAITTAWERVDSGAKAAAALQSGAWDAVVMCDTLPELDVTAALSLVREHSSDVPMIVVSETTEERAARNLMAAGASDVIKWHDLWRLAPAIRRGRHDADRELSRREQVFKAVVENSPDLIARFGPDLRRHYVNPAIEKLTGLPSSELVGRTMEELNFDPRFSGPIEEALRKVFDSGEEATLEVLLPSSAGERVFHLRIVPELGATGTPEFALVISRDITSIRRDQERLEALKREIDLLLASTYEGICATGLSGRCTIVNTAAATMLGYTIDEMMGNDLHQLVHGSGSDSLCGADPCELVKAAGQGKAARLLSEVLRRKDGTRFPVEILISPIVEGAEVRGMVASFIDVSERQKLQSELARANELASLGRVASAMSHEFNNVLMGIQPFAEVVLRSSGEPRAIEAGRRIIQSVQRGRGITEGLRVFTRPIAPVRTPIEVTSWLAESAADLERLLPPHVTFILDLPDSPIAIEADRKQILHVLSVVIHNAREAIGPGNGSIRLEARHAADRSALQSDKTFLRLSVTDDGRGIESLHAPLIFDSFFTTKESGTGLGLTVAKQIVTQHGGHMFVESVPGHGTTVHILLPMTANAVPAAEPEPKPAEAGSGKWPASILYIEDDEAVASGVIALLEDENIHVRLATDGAEAMRILRDYRPEALLVDVKLPDCNGFDLYEQITAHIGPFPVVFASGHADAGRLVNLKSSAGARFLTKPYSTDTLLDVFRELAP